MAKGRGRAIALCAAVVVITAVLVVVLSPVGDPIIGREGGIEDFETSVAEAREPLVDILDDLGTSTRRWAAGNLDDADFLARLEDWDLAVAEVGTDLAAVESFGRAPAAIVAHTRSVELYADALAVQAVALDVEAVALRAQTSLLAQRLRVLGDRLTDQGEAAIAVARGDDDDDAGPDAVTEPSDEGPAAVPFWAGMELAVGPPLRAPTPVPDDAQDRSAFESDRPTGSEDDWIEAVAGLDIPSSPELTVAVAGGEADLLDTYADDLVGAVEELRDEPDPDTQGGTGLAARVGLGLLIHADSARTGQIATLVDDERLARALETLALDLLMIGGDDAFWVPQLESRRPA